MMQATISPSSIPLGLLKTCLPGYFHVLSTLQLLTGAESQGRHLTIWESANLLISF
jgi:hypothetical protein